MVPGLSIYVHQENIKALRSLVYIQTTRFCAYDRLHEADTSQAKDTRGSDCMQENCLLLLSKKFPKNVKKPFSTTTAAKSRVNVEKVTVT